VLSFNLVRCIDTQHNVMLDIYNTTHILLYNYF